MTAHFRALPLNEALPRLLTGLPYGLILYAPELSPTNSAATTHVIELIVAAKAPHAATASGSEASAAPVHAESRQVATLDTPPEWSAVLRHPDRAVRLQALEHWAEQGTATALIPLTQALVDPDESVRDRARELVEGSNNRAK